MGAGSIKVRKSGSDHDSDGNRKWIPKDQTGQQEKRKNEEISYLGGDGCPLWKIGGFSWNLKFFHGG
jgi:hypothetical protein